MSLLLVDAGNARLKWALRERDEIAAAQLADYRSDPAGAIAQLSESLSESLRGVAISNVAGIEFAQALDQALERAGTRAPIWYARSTARGGGVHNAYERPDLLGVDRWAALVGAYARLRAAGGQTPVCVVDAGTALTIDALASDGTHLGGLILPGITLQRTALLASTADIATHARAEVPHGVGVFATDTAAALARSGPFACAAAIDRCVSELRHGGRTPVLLLAGGDAELVRPWLATACEICPNLVLEGLAILFEQRSLE